MCLKLTKISISNINQVLPSLKTYQAKLRVVKGGHNPISHQKFFQNPSPSWIFIKNPSRSYQNPSEKKKWVFIG